MKENKITNLFRQSKEKKLNSSVHGDIRTNGVYMQEQFKSTKL